MQAVYYYLFTHFIDYPGDSFLHFCHLKSAVYYREWNDSVQNGDITDRDGHSQTSSS
jgi:hypothetical protein